MSEPGRERLWALFDQAADLPQAEQQALLQAACPDDPALRADLRRQRLSPHPRAAALRRAGRGVPRGRRRRGRTDRTLTPAPPACPAAAVPATLALPAAAPMPDDSEAQPAKNRAAAGTMPSQALERAITGNIFHPVSPGKGPVQRLASPNLLSVNVAPIAKATEASKSLCEVPEGKLR